MGDYWELTLRFISLADANVRNVVIGSILLGSAGGAMGSFALLQKKALLGDALAHAALPGVCLAFMVVGSKDAFALLIGATVTAWLGSGVINYITRRSRLKLDAALALTLSVFFGIGVALLTIIQRSGSGNQSGLDKFIFGQAASILEDDLIVLAVVTAIIFVVLGLLFKEFKLLTFDSLFAGSLGRPLGLLQFIMTTLLVFAVIIGLQAVGVVLMAAMLVMPAAAARQWTNSLRSMVILSALIGAISGVTGSYVSFLAPHFPTGPWIVVMAGLIFLLSLVLAPERGLLAQLIRRISARRKIILDHLLKAFYAIGAETPHSSQLAYPVATMSERSRLSVRDSERGLRALKSKGMVSRTVDGWTLTASGAESAERVVRRHRLWEVYLRNYLGLAADHLHRDADELEHLITPEMERSLQLELNRPEYDPHKKVIPYQTTPSKNLRGEKTSRES
ncbi:MAG: metal ABC transporter permease [candidate division Zixibacteria bacterium]|nr:metal ABC transporter permease [candidate division Zixibacteria bacterium]